MTNLTHILHQVWILLPILGYSTSSIYGSGSSFSGTYDRQRFYKKENPKSKEQEVKTEHLVNLQAKLTSICHELESLRREFDEITEELKGVIRALTL